jgi:hypothetical protein
MKTTTKKRFWKAGQSPSPPKEIETSLQADRRAGRSVRTDCHYYPRYQTMWCWWLMRVDFLIE